jgi:hypothetical protein
MRKNRYGVEYSFVKVEDNLYRFNIAESEMSVCAWVVVKRLRLIWKTLVSSTQVVGHSWKSVAKSMRDVTH